MSTTITDSVRRRRRWIGFTTAAAAAVGAISTATPALAADDGLHYRGTLTTAIRYLDACGSDLGQTVQEEIPVDVFVNPGVDDGNPIVLQVSQPSVEANLAEGSLLIESTGVTATSQGPLTLHYWDLLFDGTNVAGRLVEDHVEEAAAGNLLSSSAQLVPCRPELGSFPSMDAIAEGAELGGTVSEDEVRLYLLGNVTTGLRPFAAEIIADRVG
jgi:hypothetical protein